ncbi:MAG: hypothetical protein Q8N18_08465 [Opitutaceae bacterium]|nr:hypothetical protein [Opitutaceae bacterium]
MLALILSTLSARQRAADAAIAYRGRTKFLGNTNDRVQLNVRNILDEHDLVPNRVLSTGQYVAWARVEPRVFVFTVGFDL